MSGPRRDPLFRDEAVDWARGRHLGDPTRLDPARTRNLFRILLGLVAAACITAVVVRVPTTISATAVLDPQEGRFTAVLPTDNPLREGDLLQLSVGGSSPVPVSADVIFRSRDEMLVTGDIPYGSGEHLIGRVDVRDGSSSLLGTLFSSLLAA